MRVRERERERERERVWVRVGTRVEEWERFKGYNVVLIILYQSIPLIYLGLLYRVRDRIALAQDLDAWENLQVCVLVGPVEMNVKLGNDRRKLTLN